MTGRARRFRLLGVSGACSRAGKTAVAEALLRALPAGSARAVKFTTTDDVFERCPRGTACVVCDIDVPFRLVDDPQVLRQPGTDTARLLAAGARQVSWVIARRFAVPAAWRATCAALAALEGTVVMEGSTISALARPDWRVFVAHARLDPSRWKPGSAALIRAADLVVVNRPARDERPLAPGVRDALLRARERDDLCVADVTHPLEAWAPDLLRGLRAAPALVSATALPASAGTPA